MTGTLATVICVALICSTICFVAKLAINAQIESENRWRKP